MTYRDTDTSGADQTQSTTSPLLDDGQVEPITPDDIDEALEAFDEQFPDLAGLLDAELI